MVVKPASGIVVLVLRSGTSYSISVGATVSAVALKTPFTTCAALTSVAGYLCATVRPKASKLTCSETIILSCAVLAFPSKTVACRLFVYIFFYTFIELKILNVIQIDLIFRVHINIHLVLGVNQSVLFPLLGVISRMHCSNQPSFQIYVVPFLVQYRYFSTRTGQLVVLAIMKK